MLHSFKSHKGVKIIECADNLISAVMLGNVVAHNFVTSPRRRALLDKHVSDYFWHRRMMNGFLISNLVAEAISPRFKKSLMSVSGKILLNGSAGDRARNLVRKQMGYSQDSGKYFTSLYSDRVDIINLRAETSGMMECWIETKNFFNFFHFMTESLHMAFSCEHSMRSAKKIILKSTGDRVSEFAEEWVAACREILPVSLEIEAGKGHRTGDDDIMIPMSGKHLLYQVNGPHHESINGARPPGHSWTEYDASTHAVKILGLNSFDESMLKFRVEMTKLAERKVSKSWGSRIYVARSESLLRKRPMKGEGALIKRLRNRDFEVVYFEEMSPLEQIKCVSGARCVVMQHGAGMSNMLFARADAHVLELGTYQTAMSRWGDFIPLCHAAQCHYHHIFLGMQFDGEDKDPIFLQDGLVPPVLLDGDINSIEDLVLSCISDKRDGAIVGLVSQFDYFIGRGSYKQAYRLLDQNRSLASKYGEYWEKRGDLDAICRRKKSACENYAKAWELSKSETARLSFLKIADDSHLSKFEQFR